MKLEKSKIIGAIGTIAVHALLLLVLLFMTLPNLEREEEEGLAVAMGTDLTGGDDLFEPTPASEVEGAESLQPAPEQPAAPEEALTQDLEESVSMSDSKKKKEEEKRQKELAEQKRKKEAELAEQRRKEAEKKAIEDAKRKKAEEIGNRAKSVFGGSGSGGVGNDQASAGIGDGGGKGSKGNPFGGTDSKSADGASKSGTNSSWSLAGRALSGRLAEPSYSVYEEGKIVVQIIVDKSGSVISAECGAGTNLDNPTLRKAAVEAARKTKFNAIRSGNNQSGTITYNFKLE
jgi:TonB family protein